MFISKTICFRICLIIFWLVSVLCNEVIAQTKGNPINEKEIQIDSSDNYSFFVSGHFHGSSQNTSGLPAVTVRKNIDQINQQQVNFMVCLGDLFMDIKNDIPAYKKHLIDRLKMPLYNVPGNHDKSGKIYEENFGKTFYYFKIRSELYVFLDTEMDDGNITGAQLSMMKEAVRDLRGIKNIFVFAHRLIWAEEHPKMKHLFTDNTRSNGGNNFRDEILPLLEKTGKNCFIMGGSLGNSPSPFFYFNDQKITYIATAIRDTPKDAFLLVEINNGKVNFSAFPLVMPVEYYDLKYYNNSVKPAPGFNWRLVPLYIKTMLTHRYFWYGILMIFIPLISLWGYRKRRRKN